MRVACEVECDVADPLRRSTRHEPRHAEEQTTDARISVEQEERDDLRELPELGRLDVPRTEARAGGDTGVDAFDGREQALFIGGWRVELPDQPSVSLEELLPGHLLRNDVRRREIVRKTFFAPETTVFFEALPQRRFLRSHEHAGHHEGDAGDRKSVV